MKEFVLIFRMDILTKEAQLSPEQMREYMADWMTWIEGISERGRLSSGGNHFLPTGRVLRPGDAMSDGPYVVHNESIAGYIIVLAMDLDEAVLIAKACPILNGEGTSVEVREAATPESMQSVDRTTLH